MQAYVVIRRNGVDADTIVGVAASSDAAARIELEYRRANDVPTNDPYEGIDIEAYVVAE